MALTWCWTTSRTAVYIKLQWVPSLDWLKSSHTIRWRPRVGNPQGTVQHRAGLSVWDQKSILALLHLSSGDWRWLLCTASFSTSALGMRLCGSRLACPCAGRALPSHLPFRAGKHGSHHSGSVSALFWSPTAHTNCSSPQWLAWQLATEGRQLHGFGLCCLLPVYLLLRYSQGNSVLTPNWGKLGWVTRPFFCSQKVTPWLRLNTFFRN